MGQVARPGFLQRLADLNIYETSLLPTQQEVENHKSYQQVVLDVSFITFEVVFAGQTLVTINA